MTSASRSIVLSEWQTLGPENCPELRGLFLDESQTTRSIAATLTKSRLLNLTELRNGLEVRAFSHVGRIRIGDLYITVLPKLKGSSLLTLLRYAHGFRRLKLISDSSQLTGPSGFEDLLIAQLHAEAQELISRGLHRSYVARDERLASPRGRIDVQRMALGGGSMSATLPCRHYPRIEDTLLNRVLVAGLKLAGSLASHLPLRRESKRLASQIEEHVSSVTLSGSILDQVARQQNRLNRSYQPAITIIRLLVEAQGVMLEGEAVTQRLSGFLFDMNAFFQALLSRFLQENLTGHEVIDEHGLKGMIQYQPAFNPQQKRAPTPRPDYVVKQKDSIRAILDAKYRDLWETKLPREMLYQLVVYAISHPEHPESSILYPTMNPLAREARISVTDPIHGNHIGQVSLRPLNLERLQTLVSDSTSRGRHQREIYAHDLTFGCQHSR